MNLEALISITGMAVSAVALFAAWRAYSSMKPTEPDQELVKRFVETAPLHLLKDIATNESSELQ